MLVNQCRCHRRRVRMPLMTSPSDFTAVCTILALTGVGPALAAADAPPPKPPLHLRIGVEQLRNPFWYEAHGSPAEAKEFWDKQHWERAFRQWAGDGYNAVLYWVEPWTETAWPSFLVRHQKFPEARELTPMGPAFGVRNERARAFTEAAVAELFQTYADLDGLHGGLGEALPGKRSTWYREAIAPGLKRSGRSKKGPDLLNSGSLNSGAQTPF